MPGQSNAIAAAPDNGHVRDLQKTTTDARAQGVSSANGSEHDKRFSPGDRVVCTASFDKCDHIGHVVDSRTAEDGTVEAFIHYEYCDKRLDEWVSAECLYEYTQDTAADVKRPMDESTESFGIRPRRGKRGREATLDLKGVKPDEGGAEDDALQAHHPLKPRFTETIQFGEYELKTWYYSPYPPPFDRCKHLYICPYDMKYFRKRKSLLKHVASIARDRLHPPGVEIYSSPPPSREYSVSTKDNPQITAACSPQIAVWEVDGAEHKLYCQSLCLLSKLFLDGKTLVWEVHEFRFYIVCERTAAGDHMVGYFSQEKKNTTHHLACILTLPHKQRHGYGGFIIDLSYELARRAGTPGTPERPFSDLGEAAFNEYWERTLIGKLQELGKTATSLQEVAKVTGIHEDDIYHVLHPGGKFGELKLLHYYQGDRWLQAQDTSSLTELYALLIEGKQRLVVDPTRLNWVAPTAPKKA